MRDLARDLPFPLDDTAAAACAFAAGCAGDSAARGHAQLWAYAWATRYVARAFATERVGEPSDVDAVLARILDGLFATPLEGRIADPGRFPAYVSKVCKNALLTHRRDRRQFVEADDVSLAPAVDDDRFEGDARAIRRDVEAALTVLPAAVRAVAELRFLEDASYEDIAAETGHPLPTVRTYLSKALVRLRESGLLRAHRFDDVLPPGAG